jgi:hypothetical protein
VRPRSTAGGTIFRQQFSDSLIFTANCRERAMFHVNYRYDTAHWLRFNRLVNRRVFAKHQWISTLIFVAVALAAFLRLAACDTCNLDPYSWLFGVMAGTLAYVVAALAAHTLGRRKTLKPDGVYLGDP